MPKSRTPHVFSGGTRGPSHGRSTTATTPGSAPPTRPWWTGSSRTATGPPTETYLAGPDTVPDPTGYRTEVSIPVAPSIGLSVQVQGLFAPTVERTRNALRDHGFGVLTEIDVRATLREKIGAELEDFLILGACAPELAERALDVDRQAGLLLPCTVAIRTAGDHTVVEALDPTILVRATGLAELAPVATEARARLVAALASLRTKGLTVDHLNPG